MLRFGVVGILSVAIDIRGVRRFSVWEKSFLGLLLVCCFQCFSLACAPDSNYVLSVTGLITSVARGLASRFESCTGSVRKKFDVVNPWQERLQVSLDTLGNSDQPRVDRSVLQDAGRS